MQGHGLANEHESGGAGSQLPGQSPGWACPLVTRQAARANGCRVAGGPRAGGFRTPTGGLPDRPTFSRSAGGTRRDGAGAGLETNVLALLPVPAGHGALHAGALGADCVQFHAGFHRGDGTVHRIRLHASAHHGDLTLL